MIAANKAADVDVPGRFMLDGHTARAERLIAQIDRELSAPAFIPVGMWNENGRGPLIQSIIRESKKIRETASVVRKAAA
jgi:hypothetical protein